jgi:deazaflavin-dependent oxidoreductase (nitroreductase family)
VTVRVPGKGTRGVPFPKFMARISNGFVVRQFRSGRSRSVRGMSTLILETRGAKTGQTRQAVLGYLPEPPDAWLIIGSAGGANWNPAWLHNLAKDPEATIDFGDGRRVAVRAETVEGPDLDAAWKRIEAEAKPYSDYRAKTDRQIPVVRLRDRSTA